MRLKLIFENWLILVTIASMIRTDVLFCIDELVKISQVTALVSTSLRLEEEEEEGLLVALCLFLLGESSMKHNAVRLAMV